MCCTTLERQASVTAGKGDEPFLAACAALFVLGIAGTVYGCGAMAGGMEMPGGWFMSMAWMRMPGQTWPAAAAMFLAMWLLMMPAMMLPALSAMLLNYRRSVRDSAGGKLAAYSLLAGGGYFAVQTAFGALAYWPGVLLAELAMRFAGFARWVPAFTAFTVLLLGIFQMTEWKLRQLEHCRSSSACSTGAAGIGGAWRHGWQLGLCCLRCSANLMLVQLVGGVMDLRLMALLTLAITAERLAPAPRVVARAVGVAIIAAGLAMLTSSIQ